MRVSRFGLSVNVPPGWDVRIYRRPALPGEWTNAVLHAANFPLPAVRGDFGSGAVERMTAQDVLLVLFEYPPSATLAALFQRTGRPRPAPGDFSPRQLQRTLPGQSGVQYFYQESGRAFCLYCVLGSHARRRALVPLLDSVLAGLRVGARSGLPDAPAPADPSRPNTAAVPASAVPSPSPTGGVG